MKCLESFLDERDSPLPAPNRLSVLHQLAELHPVSTADDELPVQDVSSLPTGAILSVQEVQEGIDKAPRGSAAAMSGWTFDLIAQLADDSAAGRAFTAALIEVYNLILAGKGDDASIWIRSRMIALAKKGGGIRPIAIGEPLFRLLGRILAAKFSKELFSKG